MRPHELVYTKHARQGVSVYEVDAERSSWFGVPLTQLGAFGRRRFDNWVFLENSKERIKIVYV